MIRKFALVCALLAPCAAAAQTQSQMQLLQQTQPQIQIGKPSIEQGLPKAGSPANLLTLQQLGAALEQITAQLRAYGAQQQNNPQTLATVQLMLMQSETMRNVTGILFQQAKVGGQLSPADQMKQSVAKKAAADAAPVVAQQKDKTKQTLLETQNKLEEAAKKMEQAEKSKAQKDQAQLVTFQALLVQIQARLYTIMLAELAS